MAEEQKILTVIILKLLQNCAPLQSTLQINRIRWNEDQNRVCHVCDIA